MIVAAVSQLDELYMRRCLQLAANGRGSTSPNPMVGAVIVCDGRIIGEGFHIRAGEPHAEVNAINSVCADDRKLLSRSTIYVSLEPCSHYGKTPPCCELIISCGIPRVVVGVSDSNTMVNGEGIARMRNAGIEVVVGVLSADSHRLNGTFFTLHEQLRPQVILKWAETADGYIDAVRADGKALCISNSGSLLAVHKLRAETDAILVGTHTALYDNPSLTLRHWAGHSPLRLVIDKHGILPATLNLFNGKAPTVVYTYNPVKNKFGREVEQVKLDEVSSVPLQILKHLATIKINSLMVEGGAFLLQSFMDEGLWDIIRVERNPKLFAGSGVRAPILPKGLMPESSRCFGNDVFYYLR